MNVIPTPRPREVVHDSSSIRFERGKVRVEVHPNGKLLLALQPGGANYAKQVGASTKGVMTVPREQLVTRSGARTAQLLMSVLAAAVGVSVLAGWLLDIGWLKSILPGSVTMKANTALGIVLSGAALALLSRKRAGMLARVVAMVAACGALALGALTLAEVFFGWNLGLDQWLVRDAVGAVETSSPGQMSPSTAFCLVLMGCALALASRPARPFHERLRMPVLAALSVTVILVGGLALLGYLSLAFFSSRFWGYAGMPLHTATGLVLLGAALLAWVRSEGGLSWSLDNRTAGGFVVGIVSILAAAGISYSFTNQLHQDARLVAHSQEVLKEIEELTGEQKDLTISLGRYLITRDESAVSERPRIEAAIQEDADHIRRLTADDPRQQGRIEQVERLTAKRIALSDRIIADVRQQGSSVGASAAPSTTIRRESPFGTEYPAVGQAIDRVLSDIEADEVALLQQRMARSEASTNRTFLLMPVGVYLSLTMLLLALFSLNSGTVERKQSQREMEESALRFRQLTENIREVFWLTDPAKNKMLYVSPAYDEIWGRKSQDLYSTPLDWASAIHPDDRERVMRATLTKQARGDYAEEFRIVRPDGSIRWISDRAFPVSDDKGNIVRIAGIAEDITERKQTDLTRARLAAIVESSDDAIIGTDIEGIVTDWNAGAAKLFGFSAEEMVGRPILALLPSDRLHEEDEILNRIRHGEVVDHRETVRMRKDGKQIDVSISVSPIRDTASRVIGASKIARDITERKTLEQQLRHSQKMEAVGQLTGGVAHDFNNLLGVVLGNLDLLERLVDGNEPAVQRVKNAQKAAMRGADLTRRMLAFSSRQPLNPAPTVLEESVQNMVEMAARTLGPDIRITTKCDPSVPPVLVDAGGLENVLLNLAVNARDAMPGGGSLTVATELSDLEASYPPVQAEELKPGRYARVTVSDTGHGMSRETLGRVFEPFFTTKPRGKGTGLGLAMVYGFVKQSGGTVRIYSEMGHGTTVSFYLPLAEGVPQTKLAIAEAKPGARKGGSVLVVDDEVDLLEIAIAYLEEMGYRGFHATDGASALEVLSREPAIDLLITDVLMPGGMNGVELARRVRQLNQRIKIIYSSGFPSEALSERDGTKIDGPLLDKPYQRDKFTAEVRRAMEGNGTPSDQDVAANE